MAKIKFRDENNNFITIPKDVMVNNTSVVNGEGVAHVEVPTKTSELINDSGYIDESALEDYATETYVDNGLATKYDASNPANYQTEEQVDEKILWEKGTGEGSILSKSNALNGGQALGNYSVAEGYGSDAKGDYSHVEGQLTTANGGCAHAEGQGTTAQGNCSHAEGIDTIAQNQVEHAEGQYNKSHKASTAFGNAGNTIHSVGIGTGAGSLEEQDRKNAIEIMQNGDIYLNGVGNYDGKNYSEADTLQDVINDKITLADISSVNPIAYNNITGVIYVTSGYQIPTTAQTSKIDTALQQTDIINNTTSSATNKVLSANAGKILQDQLNNLLGRGKYLNIWDCTTGLAMDTPPVDPYTYENGSYFIVGKVGTTNYRPVGSTYSTSTPSTVVETEPVKVNDTYYYESTSNTWRLLDTPVTDVAFSTLAGSPYDNTNLANALNDKQPNLSSVNAGTGISITGSGANVVISNTQTSAEWGNITGDITDQSDLQNVLDEKVTKNNAITGGTYTKITYDSKGLVTSGQNLVASDIPDISNVYATQTNLEDGLATKQDLIDEYTAQEVQALWESN